MPSNGRPKNVASEQGFLRVSISDFVATEFSKTFFEQVQNSEISVGEAVLNTRKKLFNEIDVDKYPELWREWARPILYGDQNYKLT